MFTAKNTSALLCMAVIPLIIFLSADSASADVFDGLVVMHFFDDLIDDSGNGHDLVLGGNAYIFDDSLCLDGYGDYADIGPNTFGPVNPCGGTSDFTIAFQYYCDNEAVGYGNGNGVIFDIGTEDSDTEFLALANTDYFDDDLIPFIHSFYVEIEDIDTVGDEDLPNTGMGFITYDASTNLFTLWYTIYSRCSGRGCCPGVIDSYASGIIDYSADYSTYIPRLGSIHDANDYFNDIYTDFEGEVTYFAVWDRILSLDEMADAACPPYFISWPKYITKVSPIHNENGVKHHDDIKLCFKAPPGAYCMLSPYLQALLDTWSCVGEGDPNVDPDYFLQGPFDYDVYFGTEEPYQWPKIVDDYMPAECNDVICIDPCDGDLKPGTTYYWLVDFNDHNDQNFRCGGNPVFYPTSFFTKFTTWGFAKNPDPEDNAENIDPGLITTLGWENDGYAASYNVYLYDDQHNLLESRTGELGPNTWDFTTNLGFSQTYFWRVDECNTPGCVEGPLWNFTTAPCRTIDNFEDYTSSQNLGQTWHDYDNDPDSDNAVLNGLVVDSPSWAEFVYEGEKSMWVNVDRDFIDPAGTADDYTWNDVDFGDTDLTEAGATSITVAYRADATDPPNPGTGYNENMYITFVSSTGNALIEYPGDVTDPCWAIFYVALDEITNAGGDPCDVNEVRLGLYGDTGNSGGIYVYFDLLTRCAPICRLDLAEDIAGPEGTPDCLWDYWDLGLLADQWLTDPNTDPNADVYVDHFVDFKDYDFIADQWLNQSLWP